ADVVDIFGFQAVGRANGQFQVVDGAQQYRIDLRSTTGWRAVVRIAGAFQGREDRNLVHEDAGRLAHRFFGRDNAVGLDVQHQLVQVGTLFDTGAFNRVADTAHGAVRCVKHDAAYGVRTVIGQGTHVAGHIAAALLDLDLHFQLAGFGQGGNDVIGVDDFNVVRQLDVAGQNDAGALLAQHQSDFLAVMQLEYDTLQVQQDVDDV